MARLWALLAAVALVAAACGGDSDPPAAGGTTAPASTEPGPTGPGGGATVDLSAEDTAFSPSSLEADAGPVTIRFTNDDDGIPHNLHVTGAGVDQKTDIRPGPATQRLALELEPGTYAFVCEVHPVQMKGELIVR
ncbi:MAG TPA: cupredoxin domain-containing protein [Acidimicrobiales bacterium]|nr:cupredoxin domain-containing protein [Acidimicrobiales bacterium]